MTTPLTYALTASLVGLDKSLIPGCGILAVATLASVLPAQEATGTTLVMAIVADWASIWAYRHDIELASLLRLLPSVLVGIALGAGFLLVADNQTTQRAIGLILACFVAVYLGKQVVSYCQDQARRKVHTDLAELPAQGQQSAQASVEDGKQASLGGRIFHSMSGSLAGFTTMVANAGGPVTAVYFSSEHLPVQRFVGTTAAFYLTVNLLKLPIALSLNMIVLAALPGLVPYLLLTVLAVVGGRMLSGHINQRVFSCLVYLFALVAIVKLVV